MTNRQQPCLPGASEPSLTQSTLRSSSASQPQKSPNSNPITHLQTSTTQSLREKKLNPIQPLRSRRHLPPPIPAAVAAGTTPSLQRPDRKDAAVEVHHDLPLVDALQTDVRVARAHLAQALVARGEDAAEGAGAGAGAAQRGEGGGGGVGRRRDGALASWRHRRRGGRRGVGCGGEAERSLALALAVGVVQGGVDLVDDGEDLVRGVAGGGGGGGGS